MTGGQVNTKWNVNFCDERLETNKRRNNRDKTTTNNRTDSALANKQSTARFWLVPSILSYRTIKAQILFISQRANKYIDHRCIGWCLLFYYQRLKYAGNENLIYHYYLQIKIRTLVFSRHMSLMLIFRYTAHNFIYFLK